MSCPTDRCGYTETYDSQDPSNPPRSCCWREVWKDGRCIWHSDVSEKPKAKLLEARTNHFEDLSGAVLRRVDAESTLEFSNCRLHKADFSNANFSDTDFSGSKALRATFKGGNFRRANFSEIEAWEANLSNATLLDANLYDASIIRADLQQSNLGGSNCREANFSDSDLTNIDLSSANLSEAAFRISNLSGAYLKNANLDHADLANADLTDANLTAVSAQRADFEESNLTRTNLFDADLNGASIYGAVVDGTQINRRTNITSQYSEKIKTKSSRASTSHPNIWDKTRWMYRQAEQLAKENALPDQAREYYITRKNVRRREYRSRSGLISTYRWLKATCSWAVMEYGENPRRVLGVSLTVITLFGIIYPFAGGIHTTPNPELISYGFEPPILLPISVHPDIKIILSNLYFSGVTFTTLGYGDIQPATPAVDFLATLESFIGSLLMALLVFVLGRRSTW